MTNFLDGNANSQTVGVIGGGGHVGLPLGLILADAGFQVILIDNDEERLDTIEAGSMPFDEPGGEAYLNRTLNNDKVQTTTDLAASERCDILFVVIGTPIDEHHNPKMDNLQTLMDELVPYLSQEQLLIFRSTVYPGTTKRMCDRLRKADLVPGEDIFVSFAPERIAQHKAFEEIIGLPQLIGAFDRESYDRTAEVFGEFLEAESLRLSPTEAELGKLFTNMWRYLTFAAANEFYLIADTFARHHDVNIHRILEQTSHEYPRFDVPDPGANVGGPCLTKDGWFLVDNIPYNELVSAAYQINEGMPSQIIKRLSRLAPNPDKVAILGMTFKANSDDMRNSVAFKLEKQLRIKGYDTVVEIEPNVEGFDDWSSLANSDWVILMTPHDEFRDLDVISTTVANDDALYCDVWGFWDEAKYVSDNGYFLVEDIE